MDGSQYAGLIVYRIGSSIEFLLLNDSCSDRRHWTPPKGKVASQEDERRCAEREIFQTLGITASQLNFDPEFRTEIKYISGNKLKNVVYFLAEVSPNANIAAGNHSGLIIQWFNVSQACERAQYKLMQEALQAAVERISQKLNEQADPTQPLSDRLNRLRFSFDQPYHNYMDKRQEGYMGGYRHEQLRTHNTDYFRPYQKYGSSRHSSTTGPASSYGAYQGHDGENDGYNNIDYQKERRDQYSSNQNMMLSYKTRLCGRYQASGECHYGNNCTFAHGTCELRGRTAYNNPDQTRMNLGFYQNSNRLRPRMTKPLTKDSSAPGYAPANDPFGTRAFQNELPEETPLEQRYDFLRPTTLYRHIDQRSSISQPPPPLSSPLRPADLTSNIIQTSHQFAEVPKSINLHEEQDITSTQPPKKKPQETKSVSLKDLLKDSGDIKVPSVQNKKPLVDEKLVFEFRQIIDNPDYELKDELRELTRMEFRYNLSKLQIFTLLLESLFPEVYDEKKMFDRVDLFLKFIVSPSDQETLLKAIEKLIPRSESLMISAVRMLKDMYDNELIEEDEFIKWHPLCKNNELKSKVEPLIEWLRTAEEEED